MQDDELKGFDGEYITKLEADDLLKNANENHYPSKFRFLMAHNGFRKGKTHLLIGSSSGGKSTVVRSLLFEILSYTPKGKKTLVWLSEESLNDFKTEIHKTGIIENGKPLLERMTLFSEQEYPNASPEKLFNHMEKYIDSGKYSFVFIDNITTSSFYADRPIQTQLDIGRKLKVLAKKSDAPFLLVAHTGANTRKGSKQLIDMNDIRGSKAIVNLAEFLYILQTVEIEEKMIVTVSVHKHRGQDRTGKYFQLEYNKEMMLYTGDRVLNFAALKSLYAGANKL